MIAQYKNAVVTTTISEPADALLKYLSFSDWFVVVAGDKKTPHNSYDALRKNHPNFVYLHPDEQHQLHPELSDTIGWNCIQRRWAAVAWAYQQGAQVFGFADDDNIPYDTWRDDTKYFGLSHTFEHYKDESGVFDPYSVTNYPELWHRGYPLDLVSGRKPKFAGRINMRPLVIERLVDGDPDIDAICRLPFRPTVRFTNDKHYTTKNTTVFNSQNTLVAREAIPYYLNLPGVGRFDDIFASYFLQKLAPFHKPFILFGPSTVYQERFPQDLVKNLEMETYGYRYTNWILHKPISTWQSILPRCAYLAYKTWNEFLGVKTEL